jgi:hypothetical protein
MPVLPQPRFALPRLAVAAATMVWALVHFRRHVADERSGPEARCPVNGILAGVYLCGPLLWYIFGGPNFGAVGAFAFAFAVSGQAAFCSKTLAPWRLDTLAKVVPFAVCLWLEANEPDADAEAWAL